MSHESNQQDQTSRSPDELIKNTHEISISEAVIREGSIALNGLFILAMVVILYFASPLLIPITIAIFLSVLFSPIVRKLSRKKIPKALTAGLLVMSLILLVFSGLNFLGEPATEWLSDAPNSIRELRREMDKSTGQLDDIKELAKEVEGLTEIEGEEAPGDPQPVVVKEPGTYNKFMRNIPTLLASFIAVLFITFFILVSGDSLLLKMTRFGRTFAERRKIVLIAHHIQAELSRYLATVTVINISLGFVVGLTLFYLDVPNPILWGTMVAVFNFAPYVGALVSLLVLTVVGVTAFPTMGQALMVPGAFLILTTIEGQLITPTIVGRNISISPLMVLLSVIIWGWIWGVAGALMAVPILACIKSVCYHVPHLRPIASFMSSEGSS